MTKQNILVTYFSWSGNTRYAAEYIANRLGADQFEIIREEAYPADYDACAEHAKAEKERGDRPAIKGKVDMADNLNVFDFALTDEEMQQIAAIDKGKSVFFSHQDPAIVEWFGQMVEERKKANHHPAKEQTKW